MKGNLTYLLLQFVLFFLFGCAKPEFEKEKKELAETIADIHAGEIYKNHSTAELSLIAANLYYKSKEIGYYEGVSSTLAIIADNELAKGDTKSCLKYAEEGITWASRLNQNDDYSLLLCLKGLALLDQRYFEEGQTFLKQALSQTEGIKDADSKHWRRFKIFSSMIDFFDGRYPDYPANMDSIVLYTELASAEAKKITPKSPHYDRSKIEALYMEAMKTLDLISGNKIDSLLDEAYHRIELGKELAIKKNYKELIAFGFALKGIVKSDKGLPKEALNFYLKAEPILRNLGFYYELKTTLGLISNSYADLYDHKNQSHYLQLATSLKDSLHIEEKEALRENNIVGKNNVSSPFYYYVLIFLFILLICWVILIIKKRKQNSLTIHEETSSLTVDDVESTSGNKVDMDKFKEVIALAKSNNELFYFSFLKLYPDFNKKLLVINNQFTTSDTEFCAFLKLNFDTKEIARYRNMSVRSVESKKYRIRKKLGLTTEEDIYAFFIEF